MSEVYWGLETQVDLYGCNPEIIRSYDKIKKFVVELCDLIEMKRFGEPTIVHFGEDPRVSGFSMVQLIETSLISAHFANQTNTVYLNIFSCKEYDVDKTVGFTKSFFEAEEVTRVVNYRK